MEALSMIQTSDWMFSDFLAAFTMWSVMMMAMMLPSALPMILVFITVNKKRNEQGKSFVPTWIFIFGYIIVWVSFSLVTSFLQFVLHNLSIISDDLQLMNPYASGFVLIAAGLYQFTNVKNVCLKNCQTPLHFIFTYWKEGRMGALMMGMKHGYYCIGCCWVLMALLFVAGIMNLVWVAIIALFIFLEKSIKLKYMSNAAGILLITGGIAIPLFNQLL